MENAQDIYEYSHTVVIVFGILGNILVIISILRQKKVLKNNYYFGVLHLAICDLGALIVYFIRHVYFYLVEKILFTQSPKYCALYSINFAFLVAGIGMMLIISLLRYRATVYLLKPEVSRGKLKVVGAFMYFVGLIAGYGSRLPSCFIMNDVVGNVYNKVLYGCAMLGFFFPTLLMAVVYYKIGRELIKQNSYMKNVCSLNRERRSGGSSFNILKFVQNRRAFFVCLVVVLCYGIGNIPMTVYFILRIMGLENKYVWVYYFAAVFRVASSQSVNPFIYGRLDKKLVTFWKRKSSRKMKQRN